MRDKQLTEISKFKINFLREDDGRWIADIPGLPGVTVYGTTRVAAKRSAQALAIRVIADSKRNASEDVA